VIALFERLERRDRHRLATTWPSASSAWTGRSVAQHEHSLRLHR
jgi:hypothetical protein